LRAHAVFLVVVPNAALTAWLSLTAAGLHGWRLFRAGLTDTLIGDADRLWLRPYRFYSLRDLARHRDGTAFKTDTPLWAAPPWLQPLTLTVHKAFRPVQGPREVAY
jgi:hypothetical protein